MNKIIFYIAIIFIILATAFSAGCIDENENKKILSENESKEKNIFNTSVYVLTDVPKDTDDKTIVKNTLSFIYLDKNYIVNVEVPQYRLNNYKTNTYNLYDYQRGFVKDIYIESVVEQIKQQSETDDRQEIAKVLISFVQNAIVYDTDMNIHGKSEYWAYPVETLINGAGDCDCKAILMMAVLKTAGYDALTLLQSNHLATIVSDINPYEGCYIGDNSINTQVSLNYNSKKYYIIDATSIYGVGCYSIELTEDLKDFYSIYDVKTTSSWINEQLEQVVEYKIIKN